MLDSRDIRKAADEAIAESQKIYKKSKSVNLVDNGWYKFSLNGEIHIGQYTGNEQGFECCVCGKGCKAHTFNIWYDENGGYETWGFGKQHMPRILEYLGCGEDVILDR